MTSTTGRLILSGFSEAVLSLITAGLIEEELYFVLIARNLGMVGPMFWLKIRGRRRGNCIEDLMNEERTIK